MRRGRALGGAAALGILALMVGVAACEPQDHAVPPQECGGTSPLEDPACGRALAAACSRYGRAECDAALPFDMEGQYACAWGQVITVVDASTCEVTRVEGECQATVYVGEVGCTNPCGPSPFYPSILGYPQRGQLVIGGCDEGYVGPVDDHYAGGYDDGEGVVGCQRDNDVDQLPLICDCIPAACAAL